MLTYVFTEGTVSEDGGLWWAVEDTGLQFHEPLDEFYNSLFGLNCDTRLLPLLGSLKRHTIVQMACGVGLQPGGAQKFQQWLNR
jgi:hypothetical protein